mgnify:CR=1 FL=1
MLLYIIIYTRTIKNTNFNLQNQSYKERILKKSEIEAEILLLETTIDVATTRPKNFEELYHGRRIDRRRFEELTPKAKRKSLMKRSNELFSFLVEEIKPWAIDKIAHKKYELHEYDTRLSWKITEQMEILRLTDIEFQELSDEQKDDLERFILHRKFSDTYRLFVDYSNQDSQLLHDLEMKLDKFKTIMMLAQYNVSSFYDVFSTLKQVEQGITNFAHIHNKKVVIDREYDKRKQEYNKYVDPDLLDIRVNNDYRINPEDSYKIKQMKTLTNQPKIPGAHVLLPQIGLISFDEEKTPPLAREFKDLKAQLAEIDRQLEELEE